jgi:hypothetical protein
LGAKDVAQKSNVQADGSKTKEEEFMSQALSSTQTYLYTQCPNCENSCKEVTTNQTLKFTPFPAPYQGELSEKGLKIFDGKKTYKFNNDGVFQIIFKNGKSPQISRRSHQCSNSSATQDTPDLKEYDMEEESKEDVTANKSTTASQINSPDKEEHGVYLGTCYHLGMQNDLEPRSSAPCWNNFFSFEGENAKFTAPSFIGFSEIGMIIASILELNGGRKLEIYVNEVGIYIDRELISSAQGTFQLYVLPGDKNFRLIRK